MSDITDERMATALERIADALERAHPAKFNPGGYVRPACGERLFGTDYTCTERRGHGPLHRDGPRGDYEWQSRVKWDPPGPVAKCVLSEPHQGPHLFVQATDDMPDRHRDRTEADWSRRAVSLETGEPVPMHVTVTNRQTGSTLFDGDVAKMPAEIDLPQGGWSADDLVQPLADPLDESDHRPRHGLLGVHIARGECGHWHSPGYLASIQTCTMTRPTLAAWSASYGPLTFCDCDDAATIEAENGATD